MKRLMIFGIAAVMLIALILTVMTIMTKNSLDRSDETIARVDAKIEEALRK